MDETRRSASSLHSRYPRWPSSMEGSMDVPSPCVHSGDCDQAPGFPSSARGTRGRSRGHKDRDPALEGLAAEIPRGSLPREDLTPDPKAPGQACCGVRDCSKERGPSPGPQSGGSF